MFARDADSQYYQFVAGYDFTFTKLFVAGYLHQAASQFTCISFLILDMSCTKLPWLSIAESKAITNQQPVKKSKAPKVVAQEESSEEDSSEEEESSEEDTKPTKVNCVLLN